MQSVADLSQSVIKPHHITWADTDLEKVGAQFPKKTAGGWTSCYTHLYKVGTHAPARTELLFELFPDRHLFTFSMNPRDITRNILKTIDERIVTVLPILQ